ncbi:hypothetical protein JTE90_022324 [Oedothorax gibbosus]|uniref:Secreted protein n=1 Tax=Oedothorax gibbosus TaxID=931172 RepID=A0AAV6VVF2_9ARAC|nr:hypothetical protein JTE90_022324 [Oedothorax gibbosus]
MLKGRQFSAIITVISLIREGSSSRSVNTEAISVQLGFSRRRSERDPIVNAAWGRHAQMQLLKSNGESTSSLSCT